MIWSIRTGVTALGLEATCFLILWGTVDLILWFFAFLHSAHDWNFQLICCNIARCISTFSITFETIWNLLCEKRLLSKNLKNLPRYSLLFSMQSRFCSFWQISHSSLINDSLSCLDYRVAICFVQLQRPNEILKKVLDLMLIKHFGSDGPT